MQSLSKYKHGNNIREHRKQENEGSTENMSLNNEPFMARCTLIDWHPIKLNYYPFMISLNKCIWSCNTTDDLSTKLCVPSKTNDVNVKRFNIITRIHETKTLVKHISCGCKCMVQLAIQIKIRIMINVNASVKNMIHAKKIMDGTVAHVFARMESIWKVLLIFQELCVINYKCYG